MRTLQIALAVAALLTATACERGDDRAIKPLSNKLDLRYCLSGADDGLTIPANGCLLAPNKAFALVMEPAGSLAVAPTQPGGAVGAPVWTSGSRASKLGGASATLRSDGNLMITADGTSIWDTNSIGAGDHYHLALNDAGVLTITNGKGVVTWSSHLDTANCVSGLDPSPITTTTCLVSPNREYIMLMSQAGALEVSALRGEAPGKRVWSSGSHAKAGGAADAVLQGDGNLVIYEDNAPLWNSKSWGAVGRYHLALHDDGALVITDEKGAAIWSSISGSARRG